MTHEPHHHLSGKTRNLSIVLCLGMLAGVLIWAKLRLVTDIPRSAYADPREVEMPDGLQDDQIDPQTQQIEKENEPDFELAPDSIIDPDLDPTIKP